jgi:hypothetical protein
VPLRGAARGGLVVGMIIEGLLVGAPALAQEPTKAECVAANEGAQDLQRAGRLIEARDRLATCSARACPRAVRQDCADRLHAIDAVVPSIALVAKDADGTPVPTATLTIDGAARPEALDGTAIPVDPGMHTLTVNAAGRAAVSVRVTLAQGDQVRRDVVFKPVPVTARPASANDADSTQPQAPAAVETEAPASGRSGVPRWVGWSLAGAGVASVALGVVFGAEAMHDKSSFITTCHPDGWCPDSAQHGIDAMHFNSVASNLGYALGVVSLGAAVVTLLVFSPGSPSAPADRAEPPRDAPREPAASLSVRPWVGIGNAGMTGTFR